jgi:MFS family permease
VPSSRPLARLARSVVADVTPLRVSPDYRRLWFGLGVNNIGQQMTAVTVAVQVFRITGSSFSVGLVGAFALVPLVVFGLYGGAVADVVDRRTLMFWSSLGLALLSVVLFVQATSWLHPGGVRSVWLLYLVVSAQSALFAINNPARSAAIPRLVGPELLPAANALQQVTFNLGFTTGPLLAGGLIAWVGVEASYAVDVVTFAAALYAVLRLPPIPPLGATKGQRAGFASVLEGLRFLRGRRDVLMTFLVDINAMVFGMPRALFPAVAGLFFLGGAGTVGLLSAAPAFGAMIGAVFSGGLPRVRRQGLAVLVAITVWGLSIAAFGFTRVLWLGVLFLAVAGAADMVSAVFRTTILQTATPDALRGRLQGVLIVVVAGGPRLGDVEAGSVASATNETVSIVSGGLLCVLGVVVLGLLFPSFARYTRERDVNQPDVNQPDVNQPDVNQPDVTRPAAPEEPLQPG